MCILSYIYSIFTTSRVRAYRYKPWTYLPVISCVKPVCCKTPPRDCLESRRSYLPGICVSHAANVFGLKVWIRFAWNATQYLSKLGYYTKSRWKYSSSEFFWQMFLTNTTGFNGCRHICLLSRLWCSRVRQYG